MKHLLAIQAQDARAARLAIRARTRDLTSAQVAADPELVTGWLMRGTLHLVHVEDYAWLHALTAPTRRTQNATRLGQLGIDRSNAGRALSAIERALADDGPLTREQLADRVARLGVKTSGQVMPHLLMRAGLDGLTVIGGDGRHVLARGRLPKVARRDRKNALAELARRYLVAHGPASGADLAAWSGLPLGAVREGMAAIAEQLEETARGVYDLAGRGPFPRRIPPRLLPAYDPYLLGWKDRSFAVRPEHEKRVYSGGVIRAAVTADARVTGTWSLRRRQGMALVELDMFGGTVQPALEREADDIARFEELARPASRPPST